MFYLCAHPIMTSVQLQLRHIPKIRMLVNTNHLQNLHREVQKKKRNPWNDPSRRSGLETPKSFPCSSYMSGFRGKGINLAVGFNVIPTFCFSFRTVPSSTGILSWSFHWFWRYCNYSITQSFLELFGISPVLRSCSSWEWSVVFSYGWVVVHLGREPLRWYSAVRCGQRWLAFFWPLGPTRMAIFLSKGAP